MRVVLLVARVGLVAVGGGAGRTLEYFCVGVSQSDGDVSDPFLAELDGVDA